MPPARLGPTDVSVSRQGKCRAGRSGMRDPRLLPGLRVAGGWEGRERGLGRAEGREGERAGREEDGRGAPFLARPPGTPASLSSGLRRCGEERGLQRGSRGAPPEAQCRLSPPARRSPGTWPPRRCGPTSPPRMPHVNESCYPHSLSAFPASDEVKSFNSTARPALSPLSLSPPPFFFPL